MSFRKIGGLYWLSLGPFPSSLLQDQGQAPLPSWHKDQLTWKKNTNVPPVVAMVTSVSGSFQTMNPKLPAAKPIRTI
jgi:hypothetical protein